MGDIFLQSLLFGQQRRVVLEASQLQVALSAQLKLAGAVAGALPHICHPGGMLSADILLINVSC